MFMHTLQMNDRVLYSGAINYQGTIIGILPDIEVYEVVFDRSLKSEPVLVTRQDLTLVKRPINESAKAYEKAEEAKKVLDYWKTIPAKSADVGDNVMVLTEILEDNHTTYEVTRGKVTGKDKYGCVLVVFTDNREYVSSIPSNVKKI